MLSRTLRRLASISHTADLSDEFYLQKYKDVLKSYYQMEYDKPIIGHATKEGTASYASMRNHRDVNPSNFKVNYHNELKISTLGIGSYQGKPDFDDDVKLFGSVVDSVSSGGVNHIDTAINYRYMKSERTIGAALRYMIENKSISRDQVFIASKNGYIPADGDRGILEESLINKLIELKLVSSDDIIGNCHCIHPNFLEFQLKTSLDNLGVSTLDCLYLHNAAEAQLPLLGDKFYDRLAKAFEFLETKVQEGKIKHYGMATWVCFRAKPDEKGIHLSLEKVLDIAKQVAGDHHHMNYVQLPINLMMPEVFTSFWQPMRNPEGGDPQMVTTLALARMLKVNIISSQPLLNGVLMQMPLSTKDFLCHNLGAKHLQFVRSIPSEALKTTLVGMKKNQHTKMNLEVITRRPLTADEFREVLEPKPRQQNSEAELEVD